MIELDPGSGIFWMPAAAHTVPPAVSRHANGKELNNTSIAVAPLVARPTAGNITRRAEASAAHNARATSKNLREPNPRAAAQFAGPAGGPYRTLVCVEQLKDALVTVGSFIAGFMFGFGDGISYSALDRLIAMQGLRVESLPNEIAAQLGRLAGSLTAAYAGIHIAAGGCAITIKTGYTGVGAAAGIRAVTFGSAVAVSGAKEAADSLVMLYAMLASGSGSGSSNANQGGGNARGVGGKGWRGDSTWRNDVRVVQEGGTIQSLNGRVPTKSEAIDLIIEGGGKIVRIEPPHSPPNPHIYHHINYTTSSGARGAIAILP